MNRAERRAQEKLAKKFQKYLTRHPEAVSIQLDEDALASLSHPESQPEPQPQEGDQ